MAYQNKKYQSKQKNKLNLKLFAPLIVGGFLLIAVAGYFIFIKEDKKETVNNDIRTTSTAPTAQENFNGGDERIVKEVNKDKGDAVVSDNQGSVPEIPAQSEWITSNSGEITLYSPTQTQIIKNGDYISGESSLPIVSFRIIDDISGVISTGQLSVVNGKFSGNISFSTTASAGRLDIYGTRDDGSEFSNVEVPVRFR